MASAAIATLPFSSVSCKRQLSPGASTFSAQRLGVSNSHWQRCVNPKSRTPPVPRLMRAANRVVVAQQAGSYKVAILGAAGGVGQPLSLLVKMSPLVSHLHLYDIANDVKGVAADLSHCNSPAQVAGFTGKAELANCLTGADVVVITAGVPRTHPGMTTDDLFSANAGTVMELMEAVADHAPAALIHVITNPVTSTVPVAAEVLKRKGAFDPRKLFGVTTLSVVRANALVAARKGLPLADVDVPVVGGHGAGPTVLPLLSKARPKAAAFTEEEAQELTARVRTAGDEVVAAKAKAAGEGGSATLSAAYAAARFVEASLRGLDGDAGVYECAFVQSQVTELPFFACRVRLGRDGVEEVVGSELRGLSEYEARELEALKPLLKASIDRGIAYVQQQPTTAALN